MTYFSAPSAEESGNLHSLIKPPGPSIAVYTYRSQCSILRVHILRVRVRAQFANIVDGDHCRGSASETDGRTDERAYTLLSREDDAEKKKRKRKKEETAVRVCRLGDRQDEGIKIICS